MRFRNTVVVISALCLSVSLFGCGNGGNGKKSIQDYMPKSNELSGWLEDTSQGKPGIEVALDEAAGEALVDGHIALYIQAGWVALAQEYYKNGDKTLQLILYEMKDKAAADSIYNNKTIKGFAEWTDLTLGDKSRINVDVSEYWFHAFKNNYFVEIPKAKTGMDAAGKTLATDFLAAVIKKLP